MAKRPTGSTIPQRPDLSIEEKRQAIVRLKRRIAEVEAFEPEKQTVRFGDADVKSLETSIESTLAAIFGNRTVEFRRYSAAARFDRGAVSMAGTWGDLQRDDAADARRNMAKGKAESLALLRQAVQVLEEEIEFAAPVPDAQGAPAIKDGAPLSRKIFIVHGHDEGARETVARFLERLGFEPIILHEQANRGRTVIEKVEAHGDVSFAVVLLTPDDEGCARGGTAEPRARQNVLLELGYFIGRLGRANVCTLKRGVLEIPSDFAGMVWQTMDEAGGWQLALGRELRDAGHHVDGNLIMQR